MPLPESDPAALPEPPVSFEQALARLEIVVRQLEEGKLTLSQSLGRYEEGVQFLRQCYQLLADAERKIELVAGMDAEGRPRSEPFEESAMTLEEKQDSRSKRRSRGRPGAAADEGAQGNMDAGGTLF